MLDHEVDAPEALRLIAQAVAERGEDYVYPFSQDGWTYGNDRETCLYFVPDENGESFEPRGETFTPGCIVGLALSYVGLQPDDLTEARGIWAAREDPESNLTLEAVRVLGIAQDVQDQHETWGKALQRALSKDETYDALL